MEPSRSTYRSYLLRLWRGGQGEAWRATLESSSSNARYTFADLDSLLAFLRKETEQDTEPERRTERRP